MVLKTAGEFTNDSEARLLSALTAGATVVTANNRLARQIALRWAKDQQTRGLSVWTTPDVLPWSAFIVRAADAVREAQGTRSAPLSATQERWLWAELVRGQDTGFLCSDVAFGDLAADAWRLLADHSLPLPPGNGNPETEIFLSLARAFMERLRGLQREDRARDGARVVAALQAGLWEPPALLVWAGFERLTPIQGEVKTAWERAGATCEVLKLPDIGAATQALVFPSIEHEWTAALLWAKECLTQNPVGRYALVVPDLERHRGPLTRLADEIVGDSDASPYSVSLAPALTEAPVAAAALRVFRLMMAPLEPMDAASLMHSPFVAGMAREDGARAQAACDLLAGARSWGSSDLAAIARRHGALVAARLLGRLAKIRATWPARARASVWAGHMTGALTALGWPGGALPEDYEGLAALHEVLEAVAGLDAVAPPMTYDQILGVMQEAVASRAFQGSEVEAPIQILGPLEAVGLSFDGVWVLNLHDRAWPAPRSPHPLLPIGFQRSHHLPHAHFEDDVRYAEALARAFSTAAPEAILSTALHNGVEALRPSPILGRLGPRMAEAPVFARRARRIFARRMPLEDIPEPLAPVGAPRERGYGVGLFAAQAGCSFKAAAQYRWRADPLVAPSYGLAPAVRGAVLHAALEQIFRAIPDHGGLTALTPKDRDELVVRAVRHAMSEARADYEPFPAAFVALEVRRYQRLLCDFLTLELQRPPFVVRACEKDVSFPCGPLWARGRIDRIDEVNGKWILIDYKTGAVPTLDLDADRPLHPQLLFYAIAEGPQVAGIAYAALSAQGAAYKAWVAEDALLPDAVEVPHWEQKSKAWRAALERLAEAFVGGSVRVDPQAGACDYCGRESLCRVREGAS